MPGGILPDAGIAPRFLQPRDEEHPQPAEGRQAIGRILRATGEKEGEHAIEVAEWGVRTIRGYCHWARSFALWSLLHSRVLLVERPGALLYRRCVALATVGTSGISGG